MFWGTLLLEFKQGIKQYVNNQSDNCIDQLKKKPF